MKLVRMATPGIVRRIRSSSFRKMSPDAPRFMRFSTGALACCRGISMYFTSRYYIDTLLSEPIGRLAAGVGGVLVLIGLYLNHRIAQVEM